ncbi:GNAT family N-acetyltransferase [Bacillus sp. JCM 19041]|uniref:GNAT family N-acetyltransferase n=1 Tax=Bacillus sp. JCM 19041 TaxID=1460637 RepID=UPI0006D170F8
MIEPYDPKDTIALLDLFYETIHTVNRRDYTKEQINAWAPIDKKAEKRVTWERSLLKNSSYIARLNNRIVGFCDMDEDGYVDRLFVHCEFQGEGIASALLYQLEKKAKEKQIGEMRTHASITATPFFKKRGWLVLREQTVTINDVKLTNYLMMKKLIDG